MADPVEFLKDRIIEDMSIATAAHHEKSGEWIVTDWGQVVEQSAYHHEEDIAKYSTMLNAEGLSSNQARHIVNFDPARVMRDCYAKLRLIGQYQGSKCVAADLERESANDPSNVALLLKARVSSEMAVAHLDAVLTLANSYPDHPDWDQEGRIT